MTIKKRLIISHLTVFIVPILMTLAVIVASGLALLNFAKSGNHIYIETPIQFQHAYEAVHHIIFRSIRKNGVGEVQHGWIIELLNPQTSFLLVTQGSTPIFTYGNTELYGHVESLSLIQETANLVTPYDNYYTRNLGNDFYYFEQKLIKGIPYNLHFIAHKSPRGTDDKLEHLSEDIVYLCGASLLLFVLGTSYFLSHFMLRHILPPLRSLKEGTEQINDGNLKLQLYHDADDEFKPVVDSFNLMTKKLADSLQEREQQEENRKQLIANISHDIRTPLTAIKAYVEGLRDNIATTPEKQQHYLQVIAKKTEQIDEMIEQLFLLSKIDLGWKAIPLEPLNLTHVLFKCIESNRYAWDKAGAQLHLNLQPNLFINGNRQLLENILTNIVNNSIKYKTAAHIVLTITLQSKNGNTVLTLSDDGPGVPDSTLARLTEPFYRTDKARSKTANGSGLGLAIVARAIKLLHGSLAITNVHPHGLAITLTIPEVQYESENFNH